jgi:hypothetical protein
MAKWISAAAGAGRQIALLAKDGGANASSAGHQVIADRVCMA